MPDSERQARIQPLEYFSAEVNELADIGESDDVLLTSRSACRVPEHLLQSWRSRSRSTRDRSRRPVAAGTLLP